MQLNKVPVLVVEIVLLFKLHNYRKNKVEQKKVIIFVRLELHLNYIIVMFTSFVAIKIDDYIIIL